MRHCVPGLVALATVCCAVLVVPLTVPSTVHSAPMAMLSIRSNTFTDGGTMPMSTVFNSFGCTGGNRSPHLAWTGAPSGTQSFALIMHDPDAPTGTGWYHWVLFDIPPSAHELKEGAGAKGSPDLPTGAVLGLTDFGSSGYGGPCPPTGDKPHHYRITIYALSSKLGMGSATTGAAVRFLVRGNTLAEGTITGLYGR
jgi:Raf kinase inhibitor-like YbhB/YbcL family protein